ncbi:MAG: adaptor protein MecA [Lachnospiraceae bacterium]|nr:adaptor protein MecA [Lachnospiraceae bacterium]
MKIEKINDNQIRCTLTKEDLEEHQVMLNELAMGTENARELFHDMMEQASDEFGFEVEDNPLMIEAVPVSAEKIILIITKVDDTKELSEKFSNFMSPLENMSDDEKKDILDNIIERVSDNIEESLENYKDKTGDKEEHFSPIGEIFKEARKRIAASRKANAEKDEENSGKTEDSATSSVNEPQPLPETHRMYRFINLGQAMAAAQAVSDFYKGENTLYKDTEEDFYYLLVERHPHTEEEFQEFGDVLSEFAMQIQYTYAIAAYCEEHFVKIVESDALNTLAML